jgi:hypothetical protein
VKSDSESADTLIPVRIARYSDPEIYIRLRAISQAENQVQFNLLPSAFNACFLPIDAPNIASAGVIYTSRIFDDRLNLLLSAFKLEYSR